ncbi:MAG: hypothetical protein OEW98_04150 [Betaproteobacteria bacterium]|nr:hypothetical protein [Betaproteobacteria bacterium]
MAARDVDPLTTGPSTFEGDLMHNLAAQVPFADPGFDEVIRGCFRPVRADRAPARFGMDVVERDNACIVTAENPGATGDDIEVSNEGDQAAISAEVKRAPEARDGERVLRSERYRGSI